ncbi:MAG: hypothetical protein LBT40_03870 [Deltaproteobacteria bacterium]|nr:hypothetical protein [Deltaproteobacteria bacterium]
MPSANGAACSSRSSSVSCSPGSVGAQGSGDMPGSRDMPGRPRAARPPGKSGAPGTGSGRGAGWLSGPQVPVSPPWSRVPVPFSG